MKTWVYVDKEGNKIEVYHSTDQGTRKWSHAYEASDTCTICINLKLEHG